MLRPDIFERAQRKPGSLNPAEQLVVSIAFIQTAIGKEADSLTPEQRQELLSAAIFTASGALNTIRTDPKFSEKDRFVFGLKAFGAVEWQQTTLNRETGQLLSRTLTTLISGQETGIRHRITQLQQGWIDSHYRLAALLTLGEEGIQMTPVEQVNLLQSAKAHTPALRRQVALIWAQTLTATADDDQFSKIVKHFANQNDTKAVILLTETKLKAIAAADQQTTR